MQIKQYLTARGTILALLALTAAMITVSGFIPQAFITPPDRLDQWRLVHPLAARLADLLGLHHLYTTPAFALLILVVLISLVLSCGDQFRLALHRMRQEAPSAPDQLMLSTRQPQQIRALLRRQGYRSIGTFPDGERLVRHPWGYWGKFLSHLGIVIIIAASLLIALTQQRGMLKLTVGESFQPGQAWHLSEQGLLVGELKLDQAVRLERVSYSFWPSFGLRELASDLVMVGADGVEKQLAARVNTIQLHHGLRIYQDMHFGHSFRLAVSMPDGSFLRRLVEMPHPRRPDEPSYLDLPDLPGPGELLRLKYVVNDGGQAFEPADPTLTLRIDRNGDQIGRVSLKNGQDGQVGPYRFRLEGFTNWCQLIIVKLTGIRVVFFGFWVLCLGGILHYFTPPRTVTLRQTTAGTEVAWSAERFGAFYRDEYDQIKLDLAHEVQQHG